MQLGDAILKGKDRVDLGPGDSLPPSPPDPGKVATRAALFLFDCPTAESARRLVDSLPGPAHAWLEEVTAVIEGPAQADVSPLPTSPGAGTPRLRLHHLPRGTGPGTARKELFQYGLQQGFDHLVVTNAANLHQLEWLGDCLRKAHADPRSLLLITRAETKRAFRYPAHAFGTFLQNLLTGLKLSDYQSGCRVYPVAALRRIPFQLNSDGYLFDAEIILQFRTLGAAIREAPLLAAPVGPGEGSDSIAYSLGACAAAIGLRLHQLHLSRDGRYLVDHDVHYTLKRSRTSSHMQIVSAIEPGSKVLDLGCSEGFLATPLREKQVGVTGVDLGPGDSLSPGLEHYYRRDLEGELDLPCSREFDYVVCADVIEHLRNRIQLLRNARRYLKANGTLIVSTPNIALWFYRLSLAIGRFEYGPRGVLDETHVHLYTRATIRRDIQKAGFRVLRERVTSLPFEVVFQSTGRSRLIKLLAAAYHLLARIWPTMFAYQFVLEAQVLIHEDELPLTTD